MAEMGIDELVTFRNVRVVRATASALFCVIDDKAVWLPRGQAHGKLKIKGDRGTLQIRRSLAVNRELLAELAPILEAESQDSALLPLPELQPALPLRADREATDGD